MGEKMNIFCSDEYRLLLWLTQHQTSMMKFGTVVKFSQMELATEYGSSPATINKWLKALYATKCVERTEKKGIYRITETGVEIVSKMKELEMLIGGVKVEACRYD